MDFVERMIKAIDIEREYSRFFFALIIGRRIQNEYFISLKEYSMMNIKLKEWALFQP